jgi:hypothetical protein
LRPSKNANSRSPISRERFGAGLGKSIRFNSSIGKEFNNLAGWLVVNLSIGKEFNKLNWGTLLPHHNFKPPLIISYVQFFQNFPDNITLDSVPLDVIQVCSNLIFPLTIHLHYFLLGVVHVGVGRHVGTLPYTSMMFF